MKRAKSDSDKQKRIEEILKTAKKVFIKNRFEGATIRTIATKAKLTPAAIYLYFKSKDELYGVILEQIYQKNNALLLEIARKPGTIFDRLQAVLNTYLKIILTEQDANLLDIKINTLTLSTPLRRRLEKLNIDFFNIVISIIQKGIKDGCIAADTDAVAIGYSLMSTIEGLCIFEKYGDFSVHNLKLEDVMNKYFNVFWKGLFNK